MSFEADGQHQSSDAKFQRVMWSGSV
ncbi:hypothetical protein RB2654_11198 [Rhodobacterales bacterium HTCC2654]|uniref:Uncharacterized protein n=1 Tax=Maritimibacter alkaliphilus HTCC2654 TaxID=314271 RepID=A3VFE5_9RHOB|nr:hypothetical protein RB2654_11198 [Rhodobacterales bacterium HTCC2654] [Maritimibacter alkaliphilus HTCC2654]